MTEPTGRRRWRAVLLLVLVLPVAAWVFYESQRQFRAYWASAAERGKILQWVSGASKPQSAQEWEAARRAVQVSSEITPDDPDLYERVGDLYAVLGRTDWSQVGLRRSHYEQAALQYEKAIALRPSEPQTWAMLAAARQAMGDGDAVLVHQAWSRALQLGPFEGHVQPILMQVVLADWAGASPAMRSWAGSMFDNANEANRSEINVLARRYGLQFNPDPVKGH